MKDVIDQFRPSRLVRGVAWLATFLLLPLGVAGIIGLVSGYLIAIPSLILWLAFLGFAIFNQRKLLQLRKRRIVSKQGFTHKHEVCFSELENAEIKSEKNANNDSRLLYLTFKDKDRGPIEIAADGYVQLTLLLRFVEGFKSFQKHTNK